MILEPLWETWFSGAMLVTGRVYPHVYVVIPSWLPSRLQTIYQYPNVYLKTIIPSHHITLQRANISHLWKFGKSSTQKCRLVGDMFVPKRATNLVKSTPKFSCPISPSFSPLARAHEVELLPSRKDLVPGSSGGSRSRLVEIGGTKVLEKFWRKYCIISGSSDIFEIGVIYFSFFVAFCCARFGLLQVFGSLHVKLRIRS